MGMPSVNVSFTEKAITAVKRGERGLIAMVLRDTIPAINPFSLLSISDIPEGVSAESKKQLELALMGYQNTPKKIICYVLGKEVADYAEAYKCLEVTPFNYLVIPTVETDEKTQEVATWIKKQRDEGKLCKAVLPNMAADTEGVINFATAIINDGKKEYTTEQYCSRIAGIIAGTPLTISCTYAPLPEAQDCTKLNKAERDSAIDAGKFIVYHDGEKVKVGRGINSFVTTASGKGDQFKKIKIVEAMDMIRDDITKTAEDSFLGKYENSYDNKCLLLSAIGNYFEQLKIDGVVSSYSIGIDTTANKIYLDSTGADTEEMSDDEIKQANTGDKVYLTAAVKILDAIEEINMPIAI